MPVGRKNISIPIHWSPLKVTGFSSLLQRCHEAKYSFFSMFHGSISHKTVLERGEIYPNMKMSKLDKQSDEVDNGLSVVER